MTNSSYGNFDYELCVKILNLLKVNEEHHPFLSLSFLCENWLSETKKPFAHFVCLMFVFLRGHFQLV